VVCGNHKYDYTSYTAVYQSLEAPESDDVFVSDFPLVSLPESPIEVLLMYVKFRHGYTVK